MSARVAQSELERIIEALIFSFFTYVVYLFLFGAHLPVSWTLATAPGSSFTFSVSRLRVCFLVLIAIGLGLGWGYVKGHDLHARLLRRFGWTERTSRESVWTDMFVSLNGTVQVGLADGKNIIGWLLRYSDTSDEKSLFLQDAAWVDEAGQLTDIPGAGILLTDKSEI